MSDIRQLPESYVASLREAVEAISDFARGVARGRFHTKGDSFGSAILSGSHRSTAM